MYRELLSSGESLLLERGVSGRLQCCDVTLERGETFARIDRRYTRQEHTLTEGPQLGRGCLDLLREGVRLGPSSRDLLSRFTGGGGEGVDLSYEGEHVLGRGSFGEDLLLILEILPDGLDLDE